MKFSKIIFLIIFLLSAILTVKAQTQYYWIPFTDKYHNNYDINNPGEFLSERSLERRENQNIDIDSTDIPVSSFYVDSLVNMGVTVRYKVKWLNGIVASSNSWELMNDVYYLDFVKDVKTVAVPGSSKDIISDNNTGNENADYSANHLEMVNGSILHDNGYKGKDFIIAVTDAGFTDMPLIKGFKDLFMEQRVISTRDYVDLDRLVYMHHDHGAAVMSILSTDIPSSYTGSATEASYMLLRTEDAQSEQLVEEYNWIAAAEYADSMGADIINASLGYKKFDYEGWNHADSDIDGETAPVSKAAQKAAEKGIVVVVAAGNSGETSDPIITPPADAEGVITVGAVDENRNYASFSSVGYTDDKRIKPEIMAQGSKVPFVGDNEMVFAADGTSFSTPIISGLTACLWQANPNASVKELKSAIIQSSDQYLSPERKTGYGIPDFDLADKLLKDRIEENYSEDEIIGVYPNPAKESFKIRFYSQKNQNITLNIITSGGKNLLKLPKTAVAENINVFSINDIEGLASGIYFLKLITEDKVFVRKFMKS